jgi:hypothetical protein
MCCLDNDDTGEVIRKRGSKDFVKEVMHSSSSSQYPINQRPRHCRGGSKVGEVVGVDNTGNRLVQGWQRRLLQNSTWTV